MERFEVSTNCQKCQKFVYQNFSSRLDYSLDLTL